MSRRLTTIPLLALPTAALIVTAYILFAAGSRLYLNGHIPYAAALVINTMAIYIAFTPLHDAAHRAVSSRQWLNNAIGTLGALLMLPGFTTGLFRGLHMEHHRHTGEIKRDPDEIFISAPLWLRPFTWMGLDVVWSVWYFENRHSRPRSERHAFVAGLIAYVGCHAIFLLSPYALEFVLLWMVPQRVTLFGLVYFFAYIQHPRDVVQRDTPLQATVMLRGGAWLRGALLGQNEHLMHHLFPAAPFYRYHAVWSSSRDLLETRPIVWRSLWRAVAPAVDASSPSEPAAMVDNTAFSVRLARSGQVIAVGAEQTLLAALEQQGIRVGAVCTQGLCGSCMVKVQAGTPDHRDHVLSAQQRAANDRMLVCVSRAHGELVLDL